jgi:hypothetical protein
MMIAAIDQRYFQIARVREFLSRIQPRESASDDDYARRHVENVTGFSTGEHATESAPRGRSA